MERRGFLGSLLAAVGLGFLWRPNPPLESFDFVSGAVSWRVPDGKKIESIHVYGDYLYVGTGNGGYVLAFDGQSLKEIS